MAKPNEAAYLKSGEAEGLRSGTRKYAKGDRVMAAATINLKAPCRICPARNPTMKATIGASKNIRRTRTNE